MGGRQTRPSFQDQDWGDGEDTGAPQAVDMDRIRAAADWTQVYTCDICSWVGGICSMFHFDPDVNFCLQSKPRNRVKQVYIRNMQPHSTQGYQFLIQPDGDERHTRGFLFKRTPSARKRIMKYRKQSRGRLLIKKLTAHGEYVLPFRVPEWYVIGFRDNTAVVQFTDMGTGDIQFLVVDVATGRVQSTFKDSFTRHPCLYEAYISPDASLYLLRPNLLYAVRGFEDPFSELCLTKDIRVISIGTGVSHVTHLIKDIHQSEYWYSIAFDPRYKSSRIAFGNYTSQRFRDCIAMYDLKTKSVLHQTKDRVHGSHHIAFSPGGAVLASLTNVLLTLRLDLISPMEVYLYNPDSLEVLHCVVRNVFMNNFYAGITPIFSFTGQYMALTGHYGASISVYKLPLDQSLQNQCRILLRKVVPPEGITSLPLPNRLINYLQFGPVYD